MHRSFQTLVEQTAMDIERALPQRLPTSQRTYGLAERMKALLPLLQPQQARSSVLWSQLLLRGSSLHVHLSALLLSLCVTLRPQTNAARILGLTGFGGIGKTTLARALFERLSSSTNLSRCFVPNIRAAFERDGGPQRLQQKMLKHLARHDEEPLDTEEGERKPCLCPQMHARPYW